MSANDPAFPIVASTGDPRDGVYCSNGLTKREYFAAMAMQGLCEKYKHGVCYGEDIAKMSIEVADALLAELAKREAK